MQSPPSWQTCWLMSCETCGEQEQQQQVLLHPRLQQLLL
jgi:hypothetical protein